MRPQPAGEPGELTLEQLREKRDVYRNLSRREQELLTRLEREQKDREEAEFKVEMAPIWAQEKRELELRRESGYQDWLAELTNSNTELAAVESKIASLNAQLFDTKQKTLFEPHGIDEILAHAQELPVLREAIPLLEAEIKRCENSVREWQTYGKGIARRIHEDLKLRIDDWRALRISELRAKIHQDLLKMFGTEPAPQLLESCLKDSQEYKALQSPITLPDKDSLNVDELKAAIKTVEALTTPRESVIESPPDDVHKNPGDASRSKAATRSKTGHAVSY
jgi:hypothetical protein